MDRSTEQEANVMTKGLQVAQEKQTVKWFGQDLEFTEVPILKRSESVNEYELADGAIIRVAIPTTAVLRFEGQTDAEGNPIYWVRNGNVVSVIRKPSKSSD